MQSEEQFLIYKSHKQPGRLFLKNCFFPLGLYSSPRHVVTNLGVAVDQLIFEDLQ